MDIEGIVRSSEGSYFLSRYILKRAYETTCSITQKRINFDLFRRHFIHVHLHDECCESFCIENSNDFSKVIDLSVKALASIHSIFLCQGLDEYKPTASDDSINCPEP